MGSSKTSVADRSAVAHGERGSGLVERQRAEVDHRELGYVSMSREVGCRLSRRVEGDDEDVGSGNSSGDFPGRKSGWLVIQGGSRSPIVFPVLLGSPGLGPTRVCTVWKLRCVLVVCFLC